MHRWKKPAAPGIVGEWLARTGGHHHEGRQIFVLTAEAVAEPRAHARSAGELSAGVHEQCGGIMVEGFGIETLHKSDVIHDCGEVGQQLREPDT